MLSVNAVRAGYSGIQALRGVTLTARKGTMTALIGPNGAGKSTLLNCISGVVPVSGGSIEYGGVPITGRNPWTISRSGLIHVPEGRQVLSQMTVLENLSLGATARNGRPETHSMERIYDLFPILSNRRDQKAGSLSGGEQQMLAIGRALMGAPELLLLDEPSLGLAPVIVQQVFQTLSLLSAEGLTILLVEQNASLALQSAQYTYVIEQGNIVDYGESSAMLSNAKIKSYYLGQ